MKILAVSPRPMLPLRRGSPVRSFHLLRSLARTHEVRQFTRGDPSHKRLEGRVETIACAPGYEERRYTHPIESRITDLSNSNWLYAPVLSGAAMRLCRPAQLDQLLHWADVIIVDHPWQFGYCRRRLPQGRFVFSAHNVEVERAASLAKGAGRGWDARLWIAYVRSVEAQAVRFSEVVWCVSDLDRETLMAHGGQPERFITIPNGADTDRIRPACPRTRAEAKRLLGLPDKPAAIFVGGPNVSAGMPALRWIERAAAAAPEFTFIIAGALCKSARTKGNLVITGPTDQLVEYYQAADMGLCPIEFGGGTKIKLMESMAAGLPTIAFRESIRGTGVRDLEHVLVVEKSMEALVEGVRRLRTNGELAAALSRSARSYIVEHHDWNRLGERARASIEKLMSKPRDTRLPRNGASRW